MSSMRTAVQVEYTLFVFMYNDDNVAVSRSRCFVHREIFVFEIRFDFNTETTILQKVGLNMECILNFL